MFETETLIDENLAQRLGIEERVRGEFVPITQEGVETLDIMEIAKEEEAEFLRRKELLELVQEKQGIPQDRTNEIVEELEENGLIQKSKLKEMNLARC